MIYHSWKESQESQHCFGIFQNIIKNPIWSESADVPIQIFSRNFYKEQCKSRFSTNFSFIEFPGRMNFLKPTMINPFIQNVLIRFLTKKIPPKPMDCRLCYLEEAQTFSHMYNCFQSLELESNSVNEICKCIFQSNWTSPLTGPELNVLQVIKDFVLIFVIFLQKILKT